MNRALADYTEAIRLDPKNDEAYFNRGNAYYDKEDYDSALDDYNEAIRLSPRPEFYRERASAKKAKGDATGGDADIARARQLEPT
jgi:tetratricopeptide (TPR) repeat protein